MLRPDDEWLVVVIAAIDYDGGCTSISEVGYSPGVGCCCALVKFVKVRSAVLIVKAIAFVVEQDCVFYESLGFVESELGATFCAASVLVVAFKFLCDCGFVEAEAV